MIVCPRCGHPNDESARYCSNCAMSLVVAAVPGEVRKTVTVMFMDAAGSTGIAEQADPEALRRVMTRYFDEIRAVVEHHGGVIEKYIGDAVMAVFGVPAVHEDDALRAVRAANDIRERLRALSADLERERGLSINWRTGVNTGEVVAGDSGSGQRFVSGDAVNVAARLEQAAQAGEVLIGEETYLLVRDAVVVEPVEPFSAKGKSSPLAAHRLIGVTTGSAAGPRRLDTPMVGRQRQLRLLSDAYEQITEARTCHLFTVLGSAGVGKSRLLSEFLGSLGTDVTVLHGRCLSYGDGITLWPVAEAVRQAAGIDESDPGEVIRGKIGALLDDERDRANAVERLGEVIGRFEGAAGPEETSWAVRILLQSLCGRGPVVLVLDDLHWAEPALLDLVEDLAEWLRDAPLLLVCLARQELLELRPSWGGGKLYATSLNLEPLSADDSRALVNGLLGRADLGEAIESRIATAAEGNPLYVEEMIGMLIDGGQLVAADGGWSVGGDLATINVPPTINALLEARLDGLPPPERTVLERASVEGKIFHRGAVTELAPDTARETVPIQLRALARKELIRPDRSDFPGDEAFRFRHLLIRDAAYSALPKESRAALHARFADWLERRTREHLPEYEEIIGYHYEQAARFRGELGLVDDEARRLIRLAAGHLGSAGQRALDRGDVTAAIKLLERASDLLPAGDALRTRLHADLGLARLDAGAFRAAADTLDQALAEPGVLDDAASAAYARWVRLEVAGSLAETSTETPIERVMPLLETLKESGDRRAIDKVTLGLARYQFWAGRARQAEETLTQVMAAPESGQRTPLRIWLPPILVWGPTPVPEATERVDHIRATAESRNVEAMALAMLGLLRAFAGDFEQARGHAARAVGIASELGQHATALSFTGNIEAAIESLAGDIALAEKYFTSSFDGLTEAGERAFASTVVGQLANLYAATGRPDEAERFGTLAMEMATVDDIDSQARGLRARARALALRERSAEAVALARQAVALVDPSDFLLLRGETYRDLAEVLLVAGDEAGARTAFARAIGDFEAKGVLVELERTERRLAELEA